MSKRRKKTRPKKEAVATVLRKNGSVGIRFPVTIYNAVKK